MGSRGRGRPPTIPNQLCRDSGALPPGGDKGQAEPRRLPGAGGGQPRRPPPPDPPREIGERRGSPKRGEVFLSPQHPGAIQALSKPRGHPKHAWGRAPGGVNPDVPRRDEAEPPPPRSTGGVPAPLWFPPPPPPGAVVPPLLKHPPQKKIKSGKAKNEMEIYKSIETNVKTF